MKIIPLLIKQKRVDDVHTFQKSFHFQSFNLLSFWGATDFLFERSSYLINHMTRREKEGSYRVGRWSFSLDTELLRKFWVASSPIAIRCTWYMNACKMIHFVSPCCPKIFKRDFSFLKYFGTCWIFSPSFAKNVNGWNICTLQICKYVQWFRINSSTSQRICQQALANRLSKL